MSNSMTKNEIKELLPFFVNGTLQGPDKAAVTEAILHNNDLDAEAKALASIRQTMKAADEKEVSPGEFGLTRLIAEIEKMETIALNKRHPANTNSIPLWKKFGGHAIAACFGALAVFLTLPSANQTDYAVQASGEVALVAPEMTITVSFSQNAALVDIVSVLRSEGLTIIDGPSARGVFQLANFDGGALTVAQAARLRAQASFFATVDDPM